MLQNFGKGATYSEEFKLKTQLLIAQQQVENLLLNILTTRNILENICPG